MEVKTAGHRATEKCSGTEAARDWGEKEISGVRDMEGENPGGKRDLGAVTRDREPIIGTMRFRKAGQSR